MGVLVPSTLDEALAALGEHPDALVLAGGTDLMVEINEAHRPIVGDETVVSVNRVPELRTWSVDPAAATVRLGAGVTYTEIARPPLADLLPALGQAARTVGSPQIRNAATHRRQPRHVLAGRRRAPGARRARCDRRPARSPTAPAPCPSPSS